MKNLPYIWIENRLLTSIRLLLRKELTHLVKVFFCIESRSSCKVFIRPFSKSWLSSSWRRWEYRLLMVTISFQLHVRSYSWTLTCCFLEEWSPLLWVHFTGIVWVTKELTRFSFFSTYCENTKAKGLAKAFKKVFASKPTEFAFSSRRLTLAGAAYDV